MCGVSDTCTAKVRHSFELTKYKAINFVIRTYYYNFAQKIQVMQKFFFIISLLVAASTAFAQKAGTVLDDNVVAAQTVDTFFTIEEIDDATFSRMQRGGSYPEKCTIKRSELRYLRVLHRNFDGKTQVGELVCNRLIANDMLSIFRKLYDSGYQIASMRLIDDFGADDERSMLGNNTSCFCYRVIKGSSKLSMHSRGLAIDINPLQNPCVRYREGKVSSIQPNSTTARKHASRTAKSHLIDRNDLCYKLFLQHGFIWGGAWRSVKDYQHFEKKP